MNGQIFKRDRVTLGLSQRGCAYLMSVVPQSVVNWEANKPHPIARRMLTWFVRGFRPFDWSYGLDARTKNGMRFKTRIIYKKISKAEFRQKRIIMHLNQSQLATILDVPVRLVEDWENELKPASKPHPCACRALEWFGQGFRPEEWKKSYGSSGF